MSVEQLFTKLREGTKQQQHLRAAKLSAFASLVFVLVSLGHFIAGHWIFVIVYGMVAGMHGCLAHAHYVLSRKTDDQGDATQPGHALKGHALKCMAEEPSAECPCGTED